MNIIGIIFIAISVGIFVLLKDLHRYFNETFLYSNKNSIVWITFIIALLLFISGIHLISLKT